MNLYTILGQDTLPEQVEKNKQNIAILAEEVDKLGFTPKGVYDADTEYNYNDLVFYDGKMYAVISEVAIVGVLPTNTTYWQQVTGSVIGPQGAQGPEGPAGADGQDGADGAQGPTGKAALVCTWTTTGGGEPSTGGNIQIALSYFNRTPEVDEIFYVQYRAVDTLRYYFLRMQITVVSSSAYATVLEVVPVTGADGQDGPEALVYDRNIAFTRTEDAEQLISVTLPFANFNRTPALNEDFVGILEDSGVCYVAQCEVQSRAGTNVTSIVASDINRITGADGQNGQDGTNGTNGTDGKDALTYLYDITVTADPTTSTTFSLSPSNLNRTPIVNDVLLLVIRNTLNNKSFICSCYISTVALPSVIASVSSVIETTGAQGPQGAGTQLYRHICTLTISPNAGSGYLILDIISDSPYTRYNNLNNFWIDISSYGFTSSSKIYPIKAFFHSSNSGTDYDIIGAYYYQYSSYYVLKDGTTVQNGTGDFTFGFSQASDVIITL